MPTTQQSPSRHQFAKELATKAFIVALLAFFAEWVTEGTLPSEVMRHMAARMFVSYDAFSYETPSAEKISDRIVVVDLGVPTIKHSRKGWPLTYGEHARILEKIRQSHPQSVFVDIVFQAEREDPSLGQLQKVLCALKADGVPVFLAAGSEDANGLLRPELESLRDDAARPCFEKVSVGYSVSGIDHTVWSYPLREQVGGVTINSAALAVAQTMRGDNSLIAQNKNPVMGLVWGAGNEDYGPSWTSSYKEESASVLLDEPEKVREHYCKTASWHDLIPLPALWERMSLLEQDKRSYCPRHRSIEAMQLTAPKTRQQALDLQARLQGKAVFYGGSFTASDFVVSPLQGNLPGIYLHAQATDNLIRYGRNWRVPDMPLWMTFIGILGTSFLLAFFRAPIILFFDSRKHWLKSLANRYPVMRRFPHLSKPFSKSAAPPSEFTQLLGSLSLQGWTQLRDVFKRIAIFYCGLFVVYPIAWLLELTLYVSVIGYSSILALCLFGDIFVLDKEVGKSER